MAHDGLNTDIQFLPGVGPKRAELIGKELGISTVGELLRLYPFRHIDKSTFVRIADARPDMAHIQMQTSRTDLVTNGGEQKSKMPVHVEKQVGRNDPCPCGSGKKFKNCHGKGL